MTGAFATVEPLDSVFAAEDIPCTDELRLFEHRAAVSFDRTGPATVLVVGRREPGGGAFSTERTVGCGRW